MARRCDIFRLQSTIIAQEFKNPLLDPIFVGLRESSGPPSDSAGGAVLQLYKTLRRGGRVAILTDLTVPAQLPTRGDRLFRIKNERYLWRMRGLISEPAPTIIHGSLRATAGRALPVVFHPRIEFPPNWLFRK